MSLHGPLHAIRTDTEPSAASDALCWATSDEVTASARAELASIIFGSEPLGLVLRRIAELAVATIPGADEASVMLIERGRPKIVEFSGHLGPALDERQYETGFGPCLDVAAIGRMILLDTHDEHGSYPAFGRQACRLGIRQVLSIGMGALRQTSGTLNIYSSGRAGAFDPQACQVAATFANYASVALFNATFYADAVDEVAQMQQAMTSRAGIEQAKGIIMGQQHCTAEEAFAILRQISGRSHRKLRDVAQTVINEATSAGGCSGASGGL